MLVMPLVDDVGVVLDDLAVGSQVVDALRGDFEDEQDAVLEGSDFLVQWHPEVVASVKLVNGFVPGVLSVLDEVAAFVDLAIELDSQKAVSVSLDHISDGVWWKLVSLDKDVGFDGADDTAHEHD